MIAHFNAKRIKQENKIRNLYIKITVKILYSIIKKNNLH